MHSYLPHKRLLRLFDEHNGSELTQADIRHADFRAWRSWLRGLESVDSKGLSVAVYAVADIPRRDFAQKWISLTSAERPSSPAAHVCMYPKSVALGRERVRHDEPIQALVIAGGCRKRLLIRGVPSVGFSGRLLIRLLIKKSVGYLLDWCRNSVNPTVRKCVRIAIHACMYTDVYFE